MDATRTKGTFRLEKASRDHTVVLDLPKGLHKVMRVEAVLLDEIIEQACFALLKEGSPTLTLTALMT